MTESGDPFRAQASLFSDGNEPILLDVYQEFTAQTDRNAQQGSDGLGFVLLGLFGEVGSLLSELKKKRRDRDAYVAYHDSVIEELGDVLWYFSNAALRVGLSISGLALKVSATLTDWDYHGAATPRSFADLQQAQASFSGPLTGLQFERRLLALAGKVGALLEDYSAGRIASNRDVLSADMVEIFRSLIAAADDAEVSLEDAARRNIVKTTGRWPLWRTWQPLFDDGFDSDEQLPRLISMTFKERDLGGRKYVLQQYNGVTIGDHLTDNRIEPDDYRFHDVFHLAYAAILGWSPTLRSLLKVKRKSRPEIDENEDGARAKLIEEGISTWIFNHGARQQFFREVRTLDYSLLKAIRELVTGYEVETRPLWQWELAILEGYRAFRELKEHRNGIVTADLIAHTLVFNTLR